MDFSAFSPSMIAGLLSSEEGKAATDSRITKKWHYGVESSFCNCRATLEAANDVLDYFFDTETRGVLSMLESSGVVDSNFKEFAVAKFVEQTPSDLVFRKGERPEDGRFGLKVEDGKYRQVKPSQIWDFAKMLASLGK